MCYELLYDFKVKHKQLKQKEIGTIAYIGI